MDKPMPNIDFRRMALEFKFRDFFSPRINILKEVEIKPGFQVLDYGCGPGSYVIPLTKLVGNSGKVYALDIHPLAIKMVQGMIARKRWTNVETIHSDFATGLSESSIDVVLLYDILHDLSEPDKVLKELYRVLRQNGILSVTDHHLDENKIVTRVSNKDLFRLSQKGKRVYNFARA